jgi:hypothetical protein
MKCPIKPMSLEEYNAVAKAHALQRQRSQLVSDLKTKSLNSLREVFDEDEYQAASAQRTAILQRYRQERKA